MIEYLILENEEVALDIISDVKNSYGNILLDFPIKFKDVNTEGLYYIFLVMEEFREYLKEEDKKKLVESIPEELIPLDQ